MILPVVHEYGFLVGPRRCGRACVVDPQTALTIIDKLYMNGIPALCQ